MKKLFVVAILALEMLVFAGGCIPTTAQIQTATNKTDTLMVVVDKLQETVGVLVKDGIIESEKVKVIFKEIDDAQEKIIAANEAIKEKADESALEQFKAGWETTKDYNPYYVPGALILTILGEAGALWKVNQNKNKVNAKRQADKEGRELALREIAAMPDTEITAPVVKAKMYKAIGDARRGNGVT